MAEVSNIHRLNHRQEELEHEDDFYPDAFVDFNSFYRASNFSSPFFVDEQTTSFDLGFDLNAESENSESECEDLNCSPHGEEDAEEMNLVEPREIHVTEDPIWEFDTYRVEDLGSGFGIEPMIEHSEELPLVEIDPESDCEDFEVNSGFTTNDVDDCYDGFGVNSNFHGSENERDESEWEEVSDRIHFEEREVLNSVVDRIEEISVSSDTLSEGGNSLLVDEEEQGNNIEWEVLLTVDDLNRRFETRNSGNNSIDWDEAPVVNLPEDYYLTVEHDTFFGQLAANDNAVTGSPPAAKSVVENLPMLVLKKEELEDYSSEVVCAVCKDEIVIEEKVTRMPCCHLYHGDCILPWLRIRNTCPVCRYELPTDDVDYERRRRRRERVGASGGAAEVRYNFEVLP